MTVYVDESVPIGTIYVTKNGNTQFTIFKDIIDCIDHTFNCYDKLIGAVHHIHKNKHQSYIDVLSNSDKQIIQKVIDNNNTKHKSYWKNLLNKNTITYKDGCYLKLKDDKYIFETHDRPTNQYATKWIDLSRNSDSKIQAIIDNQLYLASPMIEQLNDNFDCQYMFGETDINDITQRSKLPSDIVKQYIYILNSISRISCLSMHDPLSTTSSESMWNRYGSSMTGIAVIYKLRDVIYHIVRLFAKKYPQHFQINGSNISDMLPRFQAERDFVHIKNVAYIKEPISTLRKNLIEFLSNHSNIQPDQFEAFLLDANGLLRTKDESWKDEKELRIIGVNIDIFNHPTIKQYSQKNQQHLSSNICNQLKLILEEQKLNPDRYKLITFIAPHKIVLGQQCDESNDKMQNLIKYCKSNKIDIFKLPGN